MLYTGTGKTNEKNNNNKIKIKLPVKIEGDSYTFDIAESKYDNQTYHPPMLWERELNLKKLYW